MRLPRSVSSCVLPLRGEPMESLRSWRCGIVPLVTTALVMSLLPPPLPAVRQDGNCRFPTRWEGTWFQSGVRQPITIEQNRLSTKGRCIYSEGDKFVVVNDKGVCFRCVVIHEKHSNVLQYKETYCHAKESLQSLCSLITGDALLYSMFRVEASPVRCPFIGPFTFTYNRGHGDCKSPVSSIDSCTEESRLLLRYQACPDVHGTESTVEELQCLATWKEGSSRYLVGKVRHSHATSNEDRYRCFVYEKATLAATAGANGEHGELLMDPRDDGVDFRVAQSGDATCNGLFSPMEGSRTMTLKKAPSPSKCGFPPWLTASPNWHTLDYHRSYSFYDGNVTLRITNTTAPIGTTRELHGSSYMSMGLTGDSSSQQPKHQEMRVVCTEVLHSTLESTTLVTHFTMGCESGYLCMMFYRRDGHVIEVQTGAHTRRSEEACHPPYFNRSSLPFVTLVTSEPELRQCPYLGKFSVTGMSRVNRVLRRDLDNRQMPDPCTEDFTTLVVGCSTTDTMEFQSECTSTDVVSAYSCHGRWEDNGTSYLITTPLSRSSHGARRYCFMYREVDGIVHFSSSSDSCQRNISPGVGGTLAFNVTSSGQCMEPNSASFISRAFLPAVITVITFFTVVDSFIAMLCHVAR
ncbi:uncharacterized protein [Anabrus simplex]|uniref:uncharacterized protein n=1 Tax=Anabrus simplex TaxID=316456 RepID=UPI0035A328AA